MRLGAQGIHEIKEHFFFQDIEWPKIEAQQYAPPFKINNKAKKVEGHFVFAESNDSKNPFPVLEHFSFKGEGGV